jgi:hypothetical protein
MTDEQLYAVLMRLYPTPFRREYEAEMRETFAALCSEHRGARTRLWLRIVRDLFRSAARERFESWTNGEGRVAVRWMVACASGAAASGVVILLFMIIVEYLFPTRADAYGVFHSVSRSLPTGVYGAIIATVIGFAQSSILRQPFRVRLAWVASTAIAGGAGTPIGLTIANSLGRPAGLFALAPYFAGVLLLGALVGLAQSVAFGLELRRAMRWVVACAIGVCVALMITITLERLILVIDPRTWRGLAVGFAALPAITGFIIGVLTVRPLTQQLFAPVFRIRTSDQ